MGEGKRLVVNCDVCDTRKVNEEELKQFAQILINTDQLLVNERSKAVLNRLPIKCNMDEMMQLEEGEEVGNISYNGSYEITGDITCSEKKLLHVNGKLVIAPKTEEVIKSFLRISVNGILIYPNSMSAFVSRISVNGTTACYPDDYKIVESKFVIDRYFPIRAKKGGKYFAAKMVQITDTETDLSALVKKGVHFKTKELYILEEKLEDCVELFDEDIKFCVIPNGFSFVGEDVNLDKKLIQKYGNSIYVVGDLVLGEESREICHQIEGLQVKGTIYLSEEQLSELKQKNIVYEQAEIIKGTVLSKKSEITLNREMLLNCKEGISFIKCAVITIAEDVLAEEIAEKVCMVNCAVVKCNQQQQAAVELVGRKVASIQTEEKKEKKEEENQMEQIINADWYIL